MTRLLIVLMFGLLSPLAQAGEVRTLGWADLVPAQAPLVDPLNGLDMWVRYDLGFIAKVMADAEAGRISRESSEYAMARQLMAMLDADGLQAEQLVRAMTRRDAAIEQRKSAVNDRIDGQLVRLPGYALPLSAAEGGVQDFLLVPYVGACIHYPPPPPNQVVRATLETPHRFDNRFETVWITGRLSARAANSDLDYVDGQARVETSYSMEVVSVEAYADGPKVETYLGSFSPTAQAPKLRLSRSGLPHAPLPSPMTEK